MCMLRINTDIRLKDISFKAPEMMSLEELNRIRDLIYAIPPEELIKAEEGRRVARYLTRISEEIRKRLYGPSAIIYR